MFSIQEYACPHRQGSLQTPAFPWDAECVPRVRTGIWVVGVIVWLTCWSCSATTVILKELLCRNAWGPFLRFSLSADDITLTIDGKDTYEEVKTAGRYR